MNKCDRTTMWIPVLKSLSATHIHLWILPDKLVRLIMTPKTATPTWVDSYSYPDGHVRHVSHMEGSHWAEDVQRHVGDLSSVLVAIFLRQAWCYHVSITDGLHLDKSRSLFSERANQVEVKGFRPVTSETGCLSGDIIPWPYRHHG